MASNQNTTVTRRRERTNDLRAFIVDKVEAREPSVARVTAKHFGITRQAVHKHIRALVVDGLIAEEGIRRGKRYSLAIVSRITRDFPLAGLEEHEVWQDVIKPWLADVPDKVSRILVFGITEMINNAIDHSEGTTLFIAGRRTARIVEFFLQDDGVGIFQKIQNALGLADEREGVLELTKGKLTTDPSRHSGEGIFFTSRMCDSFSLMSGTTALVTNRGVDWALEMSPDGSKGTLVVMKVKLDTERGPQDVFDQYSSIDGGFAKTNVPVTLAKYAVDGLVSRSQAKRLLSRFERFQEVMLDFAGVDSIGQAFADEVFRVFARMHPEVTLTPINANARVSLFINRARIGATEDRGVPLSERRDPAPNRGGQDRG